MKEVINSIVFTTLTVGFIGFSQNYVKAQGVTNNQQPQPYQNNEVNPLYGTSGFNPMQLIHNANFMNGRNGLEFAEDADKNINSAAEDFKQQQLKRMMEMQKQQQSTPSQPMMDNQ